MLIQVCFNLAEDLRNMKGKGARLFAKRQAKSESWTVGADEDGGDDTATSEPAEPSASIQEKLSAQHRPDQPTPDQSVAMPVNRLKEMVELPRPAMSPWEAAAKYGSVDPAFAHLTAGSASVSSREDSGGNGPGTGRVKSWTGDQDAAASQYC